MMRPALPWLIVALGACKTTPGGVATPCAPVEGCGSDGGPRDDGRPEPTAAELARDRALLDGWAVAFPRVLSHRQRCARVLGWVRWPIAPFTCPPCPPNAVCEPCDQPWVVVLEHPIDSATLDRGMIDGTIAVAEVPREGAPPETGAYLLEGVWVHPRRFEVRGFLPVTDSAPPPDAPLGDFCRDGVAVGRGTEHEPAKVDFLRARPLP